MYSCVIVLFGLISNQTRPEKIVLKAAQNRLICYSYCFPTGSVGSRSRRWPAWRFAPGILPGCLCKRESPQPFIAHGWLFLVNGDGACGTNKIFPSGHTFQQLGLPERKFCRGFSRAALYYDGQMFYYSTKIRGECDAAW